MKISSIIFSAIFFCFLACAEETHRENANTSNDSKNGADNNATNDSKKNETNPTNTNTTNTNNTSSQVTSNPKPYAVTASLSGGNHETKIEGETETPVENSFSAVVGLSDLIIYLLGSDASLITIIIDMKQSPLPGSVTVGFGLESAAYITVGSMGQI